MKIKRECISLGLAALVLSLALEWLNRASIISALAFIWSAPIKFAVNLLIVLATLSVSLLFRRGRAVSITVALLWLTFGIVNRVIVNCRTLPFSMGDVLELPEAIKLIHVYFKYWQIALLAVAAVALAALIAFAFMKIPKRPRAKWKLVIPSVALACAVAVGSCLAASACGYMGASFENLIDAYREDGFSYCFAYTFWDMGIDRPEDYSPAAVDELVSELEGDTDAAIRPNVIFLQMESFIDPSLINCVTLSENPTPNFCALKEDYPSGYLMMPMTGGGTANCEFEVLTGMNTDFFGASEVPYNTVLESAACEAAPYNFREYGYYSTGIHNFSGSFYNRHIVYKNLGFDRFDPMEYMDIKTVNPQGWPDDAVIAGEVARALTTGAEPDFIFITTMQCHGPYPEEPISQTGITAQSDDARINLASVEYYASQLKLADEFLGNMIAEIERIGEPTIVFIYGDHLPALGFESDMLKTNSLFATEYAIWSNFAIDAEDRELEAYQAQAYVQSLLGMSSGILAQYHQSNAEADDYLDGLEILQYDMLYGERDAYSGESPYAPTDMAFGLADIEISGAYVAHGQLYVEGAGFTPYSEIYINGERADTVFVDAKLLIAPNIEPEGEVKVAQISMYGIFLSECAPVRIS